MSSPQKMNTLAETYRLSKEHGIGISKRMIMELAKTGEIPSVKAGNKILVNWDGLIHYLDTHTLEVAQPKSGIRKISE